ncbi:divalent-cation tolerance protein CutA [Nitrosomonas sp.]|uniref:divalent-cation tolerance protein CutA n=1 Tax=Nitrosomonas sp. TaxID=42353 RepID=UPI00263A2DA9|nr:divalent-cation tolerance protein CutA [Nitrosomonas sp.]MCW5597541.1 divalent-cation tolerance protein CutA [Nitrosomonas sp.]MCW5601165.1 divalent-cation tolerance protein CutA [Nitrosomonas sp.]
MEIILIITNFPDKASALKVAQQLIEDRLAACVNILAESTSVYRWQAKIETANEIPLIIKTVAENYEWVEKVVKSLHPYELPEIIAVPVKMGLPAYLQWVTDEVSGL